MNEYFAQTLAGVLEETSTNMGNAMVLDHLAKNGTVSIEEAEFYHNLCTDVITEAAEDFIPDTIDVPDAPEDDAPIDLFDAVGNHYIFQNGQLIPADDQDPDADPDAQVDDGQPVDPNAAPDDGQYQESITMGNNDPAVGEDGKKVSPDGKVLDAKGNLVAPDSFQGLSPEEKGEVLDSKGKLGSDDLGQGLEESSTVVARILANLK